MHAWVHVTCDGLSMEEYDLFFKLSTSVINVAYCCNLNQCYSCLNQLASFKIHDKAYSKDLDQVLKPVVDNHRLL